MSLASWFGTRKARHAATAGVVVLATGGLFLLHANAATPPIGRGEPLVLTQSVAPNPPPLAMANGPDTVSFAGPRVHGTLAVSDSRVLAESGQPFYADVTLTADAVEGEHAPLALAVVLDTSGSMQGEKLREAKSAVKELVRTMRDDDEIAFVHYSDTAQLVQPLTRVGAVRERLASSIDALTADGGTAIPLGLEMGVRALDQGLAREELHEQDRVRRVVLVSDGLDGSRPRSESLAHTSSTRGMTVSSMGIGLDFDEAYMGGLARAGHGNFGFVNDGPTLTAFLHRELVETATTVAQGTVVHLHLPEHARFVKATGADAEVHGRDVDLRVGAIYAQEPKRVLLQMTTDFAPGTAADFSGSLTWRAATGDAEATIPQLTVRADSDAARVLAAENPTVLARVASVEASERQVEAAQAYASGDARRAQGLIRQNIVSLKAASAAAPAAVATGLALQAGSYDKAMKDFESAPPASTAGRYAAKRAAASNMANASVSAF